MYLLPAGDASRTKNKWGMGALGIHAGRGMGRHAHGKGTPGGVNGLGAFKRRPGLDCCGCGGKLAGGRLGAFIHARNRFLRGLGDDPTSMFDFDPIAIPTTPGNFNAVTGQTQDVPISYDQSPTMPAQNTNPSIATAYANVQSAAISSQDPLDYVSPQAAIAAGLPSQTVYNSWSSSLARFSTQAAALQAGIPAGAVTQLWTASRSAVPAAPATSSFFSGTTLGISNTLLFGGLAIAGGLVVLKGRR